MFGAKLSSVLASGVLVLGGGAIALAQAGGPDDPPGDATEHAQSVLDTLEVVPETATDAVRGEHRGEDRPDGDGEGEGATAFSEWVEGLELEGCERGLTIAANAQNGPTDFTAEEAVEAPSDHPAFTRGDCTEGDGTEEVEGEVEPATTGAEQSQRGAEAAEQGQANRPDDAGEQGGRETADDARGDAGVEQSQRGAEAAERGQANRPDDAGEQGGQDRADEERDAERPGRP